MRIRNLLNSQFNVGLTNYYSIFCINILPQFLTGFILKSNSIYLVINSFMLHVCLFFLKFSNISTINCLVDIVAVDFPTRLEKRFELIYAFWNIKCNYRFYIKTYTNTTIPVMSIASLFNSHLDWSVKSEICLV